MEENTFEINVKKKIIQKTIKKVYKLKLTYESNKNYSHPKILLPPLPKVIFCW